MDVSTRKHIVSAFDDDLTEIQAKIAEMGGMAEDLLSKSLTAIETHDASLAEEVIVRDKRVDAMEFEIEQMATTTIALRQPMAQDLRVLISALKICSTLERIGDLAKNIAKRVLTLPRRRQPTITASLLRMGRQTLAQLSDVLDAYASGDTEKAVSVWHRDVEIDEMYNAAFREVVTYMMEDSRMIGAGAQLLFIAKNLERIGDHTTHISEMIYYIKTGTLLGDDRPKGEPLGPDFEAE